MRVQDLSDLQKKVFEEAKKRLIDKDWYSGVCLDNFPTDKAIKRSFEDAVCNVMMETAYWDAPNFFNS